MFTETGCYRRIVFGDNDEWLVLWGIFQELCWFRYSLHQSAGCYQAGLLNMHSEWQKRDLR